MLFRFDDNYTYKEMVFSDDEVAKIVFMRGLPRCGKSTMAKNLCPYLSYLNYIRVCGDDFRLATHGQTYNRLAEPHVSQSVLTTIRALIISGYGVLFDETNSSEWSLRRIFEIDRYAAYVDVQTPKSTCLENNIRSGKNIPDKVFDRIEYNLLSIDPEEIRKDYL
jgi:predicted kinase